MLEPEIHTYGYIDAMFYVLNGMAMIMNHAFMRSLMTMMTLVTAFYYVLMIAYSNNSAAAKQYIGSLIMMLMLIHGALYPVTSITLYDNVTKRMEVVDNLPIGFAAPVGIAEGIGSLIAQGFEQAFHSVGGPSIKNYRQYGMVFGARLIGESRNWRIENPQFKDNLYHYFKQCVIPEVKINRSYTEYDIINDSNAWELISLNTSNLRRANVWTADGYQTLMRCPEAAQVIDGAFQPEITRIIDKYSKSDFAAAHDGNTYMDRNADVQMNRYLKNNIKRAFSSSFGIDISAEDAIRQQLMRAESSEIGDRLQDFGYARALQQQESGWLISGKVAQTIIPVLLNVVKGLVYASFILSIPMFILGGGIQRYAGYMTVVMSLQLWPALNMVLNVFIDGGSSLYTAFRVDNIISMSSLARVGHTTDVVVAVASGLQMVVPLLAFAIVKGGVSGFIHLASNITSAASQAATSVASEVTTGNRSLDNVNMGNMQIAMQSGFKTDLNSSYARGAQSFQHMDGTMERVLGNGETLFQSGTGLTMSGGSSRITSRESALAQASEHLTRSQSLLDSDSRTLGETERATFNREVDFVASLAQAQASGKTIDFSVAGEDGEALKKVITDTEVLRTSKGYSYDKAAQTALKAYVSANTPGAAITSFLGVSGGVSGETGKSTNETTGQGVGKESNLNTDNINSSDYSKAVRASINENFVETNHLDKNLSDRVRSSHERQVQLEASVAKRHEEVQGYSSQVDYIKSQDATWDQDNYHRLENRIAATHNISSKDAHQMIEQNDPKARAEWNKMLGEQMGSVKQNISISKHQTARPQAIKVLDDFTESNQPKIQQTFKQDNSTVKDEAAVQGIDKNNKDFVKDNVSKNTNQLLENIENKIETQKNIGQKKKEKINKQVTEKVDT